MQQGLVGKQHACEKVAGTFLSNGHKCKSPSGKHTTPTQPEPWQTTGPCPSPVISKIRIPSQQERLRHGERNNRTDREMSEKKHKRFVGYSKVKERH